MYTLHRKYIFSFDDRKCYARIINVERERKYMKNVILMMSKIEDGGITLLTSICIIGILVISLFLILNRNQKLNYLKKVTSVALILTMLLLPFSSLLNVEAEATNKIDVDSNNKVVNMVNISASTSSSADDFKDEFRAYKVLDAYYNKSTNEMTYSFTNAFQEFLSNSTDDNIKNLTIDEYISYGYDSSDSTLTDAAKTEKDTAIRNLADSFARYIKSGNRTFQTYDLTYTDSNTSLTCQVEVGSYLILPTSFNSAYFLYYATIVNVVFEVQNNSWFIDDIHFNIKYGYLFSLALLFPGTPDDFLSDEDGVLLGDGTKTAYDMAFRKNKVYTYIYLGNVQESTLTIKLPDGLKFVPGELKYASTLSGDEKKTSEIKDKLIDEKTGTEYATTILSEKQIVITIPTTILDKNQQIDENKTMGLLLGVTLDDNDESIVLGESKNIIKTDSEVVVDPYTTNPTKKPLSLENKVTTYGLEITNKAADDSSTLLSNSSFGIYTDEACSDENLVGTLTTDNNGIAKFKGIINDTYYIKQIKATSGYKLNTNPVKVTVDTASLNSDNYFPLEVTSEKAGLLPSTGGLGTIFYTLVGLVVIGIGAYEVIKYSKRQVNS